MSVPSLMSAKSAKDSSTQLFQITKSAANVTRCALPCCRTLTVQKCCFYLWKCSLTFNLLVKLMMASSSSLPRLFVLTVNICIGFKYSISVTVWKQTKETHVCLLFQ